MAQHNPRSRSYLLIVMVGIVVCFVIALFVLGGGDSETDTAADQDGEHKAQTSEPGHEDAMPGQDASSEAQMRGGAGMTDDVSPPDEMVDEPLLDGAPAPEMPPAAETAPAPETPTGAQNP